MTNKFNYYSDQQGSVSKEEYLIQSNGGRIVMSFNDIESALEFVESPIRSDINLFIVRQVTEHYVMGRKAAVL